MWHQKKCFVGSVSNPAGCFTFGDGRLIPIFSAGVEYFVIYFVHLHYDDPGFRVFAYQRSEYAVALCHNLKLIALRSIHNFC